MTEVINGTTTFETGTSGTRVTVIFCDAIKDKTSMNNDTLAPTLAQLQDLLTWEDGWNSYNALAPKPANIAQATTWITDVHHHLTSQNMQWISPNVTGGGDGEVVLSWHHNDKSLTVYIDDSEEYIYYIQLDGKGINAPMYDGDIKSIDDMQQLWQWLLEETKA